MIMPPTLADLPEMLTADDVGEFLQIGRTAAYELVGKIGGFRVGPGAGALRLPKALLIEYLASCQSDQASRPSTGAAIAPTGGRGPTRAGGAARSAPSARTGGRRLREQPSFKDKARRLRDLVQKLQ